MAAPPLSLILEGDAATARLGAVLAPLLQAGDLVLLEGELGTGKTALARALIRALAGDAGMDVPSPSFSLVQPYEANGLSVLHADLYRLADESELAELGLLDDAGALVLIEWPERAPDLYARASLLMRLGMNGADARTVLLESRRESLDLGAVESQFA